MKAQRVDLKRRIEKEPWRFDFFQLVQLIETDALQDPEVEMEPIGESAWPRLDALKFKANPGMVFEPATVRKAQRTKFDEVKNPVSRTGAKIEDTGIMSASDLKKRLQAEQSGSRQWEVFVNIMLLTGASGILPYRYSELILQRLKAKDHTLKDFLDIFNHRTLSLFYRAWKKYRPIKMFETRSVNPSRYLPDWYLELNKSLTGTAGMPGSFDNPNNVWLNYAGAAAHQRCNEYTLKNVISHHFGLKVNIHQFKGKWSRLDPDVLTQLAGGMSLGMNNMLGQTAILGSRCWVMQNLFEIEIVDFDEDVFTTLAPGSKKLTALYNLVKQRAGVEMDFDLSLKVREDQLPAVKLGVKDPLALVGWSTRLYKKNPTDKLIKISLSKHGMQTSSNGTVS
ncbi:MAG: type VI secretion system baseplate subunit TssG [Pseudomonadales bacterium]|nr:type VI secretion system baseplate subunit TssG [Pseudomonadales bacterium]